MASVSPSSSASQVKAPADVSWLSPQDLCALLDKAKETGVADVEGFVNRYMAYSSAYLRVLEKGYDSGSATSSSSRFGGSRLSQSSRSVDGSRRAISRVPRDLDWRATSKSVLRPREVAGRCFEKLLVDKAGKDVGDSPSFFDLLAMPAKNFQPDAQLQRLRMDRIETGLVHVGSDAGDSAYSVLAAMAGASAMPYTGPDSMWSKMRGVTVAGVKGFSLTDVVGVALQDVANMKKIFEEDLREMRLVNSGCKVDMVEHRLDRASLWSMDLYILATRLCDVVVVVHKSFVLGFLPVAQGMSDGDIMRRVFIEFSDSLDKVRWLAGGKVPVYAEHARRAHRIISGKRCFMLRGVAPGTGAVRSYPEVLVATVPGYLYALTVNNEHVVRPVASITADAGPWIPVMPGVGVGSVEWSFGKELEDDGVEIRITSGLAECSAGPVTKVLGGDVYYVDFSRGGHSGSDYGTFRHRAANWQRVEGEAIPLELYLNEERQVVGVIAGDMRP